MNKLITWQQERDVFSEILLSHEMVRNDQIESHIGDDEATLQATMQSLREGVDGTCGRVALMTELGRRTNAGSILVDYAQALEIPLMLVSALPSAEQRFALTQPDIFISKRFILSNEQTMRSMQSWFDAVLLPAR